MPWMEGDHMFLKQDSTYQANGLNKTGILLVMRGQRLNVRYHSNGPARTIYRRFDLLAFSCRFCARNCPNCQDHA